MSRLRILVVEDNPMNQRLAHDVLVHAGHEVVKAASVEEARTALKDPAYDIVLLDVQIPGGGGEMLVNEIRKDRSLAHVPVVAVTAFAMVGDRERLIEAGFDGYMTKPINTRTFAKDVEAFAAAKGNLGRK